MNDNRNNTRIILRGMQFNIYVSGIFLNQERKLNTFHVMVNTKSIYSWISLEKTYQTKSEGKCAETVMNKLVKTMVQYLQHSSVFIKTWEDFRTMAHKKIKRYGNTLPMNVVQKSTVYRKSTVHCILLTVFFFSFLLSLQQQTTEMRPWLSQSRRSNNEHKR